MENFLFVEPPMPLGCSTSAQSRGPGTSFTVNYPGATATSVYGPDNLAGGKVRLVGAPQKRGIQYLQLWIRLGRRDKPVADGVFGTIAYPGAVYQFTHSTMGTLAARQCGRPEQVETKLLPIGPGVAYTMICPRSSS